MRRSDICLAVTVGAVVFAARVTAVGAEPSQEPLRTIIEKTREREVMIDGFEWRLSLTGYRSDGTVEGTGEIRWVESKGRWFYGMEGKRAGEDETGITEKYAWDGKIQRILRGDSGRISGHAAWPDSYLARSFGLRAFGTAASLSDVLGGDKARLREKYPGDRWLSENDLEVALVGQETVEGRACDVVEYVFRPHDPRQKTDVIRACFARELNYACVAVESSSYAKDDLRDRRRCELGDFREVKAGLFVPFSQRETIYNGETGVWWLKEERITRAFEMPGRSDDSLFTIDFPAGTSVQDSIAHTEYVVGEAGSSYPRDAILEGPEEGDAQATGSTSDAVAEAVGGAASTLEKPATGERAQPRANWLAPGVIAGAAATVAAAVIFARRRRRGT